MPEFSECAPGLVVTSGCERSLAFVAFVSSKPIRLTINLPFEENAKTPRQRCQGQGSNPVANTCRSQEGMWLGDCTAASASFGTIGKQVFP